MTPAMWRAAATWCSIWAGIVAAFLLGAGWFERVTAGYRVRKSRRPRLHHGHPRL